MTLGGDGTVLLMPSLFCEDPPAAVEPQRIRTLTAHAHADVDFCVTLGGDGTVLHLTSLFSEDAPLPPLVSFAMGTLGFLTPFDVADYRGCLVQVLALHSL